MKRVVVIGGSGHVGTFLVPRLVEAGYQVINVSRGEREPYQPHKAWNSVQSIAMDRDAEDAAGTFGDKIAALEPDIVIDKICFTLDSARQIVEALKGKVSHFLHTGTIEYGTQKSAIEDYLLGAARRSGFPATVIRPGHIVGPGWAPLNPAGHFNPEVFSTIARGERLVLPNFGLETVHHVHADDVAQMFMGAIENWRAATGEAFNTVSPAAVTLRGYAEAMYAWFGHQPNLEFLPYGEWAKAQTEDEAQATLVHIARSPSHSIAKAQSALGYAPRYSSLAGVKESVRWLIGAGVVDAPAA
ncbi:MAG: NAD-dependent epimerase/dehydratase family protein [Alphaproteobacteria bacterium]